MYNISLDNNQTLSSSFYNFTLVVHKDSLVSDNIIVLSPPSEYFNAF